MIMWRAPEVPVENRMEHANALSAWESFYVIVGSSGGALIGLQFVVITLIADRGRYATAASLSAFGTPTVVHLAGALVVSALMSAPWRSLALLSIAIAVCGVAGLLYGAVVIRRARRQTESKPVWEDWIWYATLPCIAYATLGVTAIWLRRYPDTALFLVGGTALALLLIGIHNAWDTVVHIVLSAATGNGTAGHD
jgi:hypothetical protein